MTDDAPPPKPDASRAKEELFEAVDHLTKAASIFFDRAAKDPALKRATSEASHVVDKLAHAAAPAVDKLAHAAAPAVDKLAHAAGPTVDKIGEAAAPVASKVAEGLGQIAKSLLQSAKKTSESYESESAASKAPTGDAVAEEADGEEDASG